MSRQGEGPQARDHRPSRADSVDPGWQDRLSESRCRQARAAPRPETSSQRRVAVTAAVALVALLAVPAIGYPCGPILLPSFVGEADTLILQPPDASFIREVALVLEMELGSSVTIQARDHDPFSRTTEAALADLSIALDRAGIEPAARSSIEAAFTQLRSLLERHSRNELCESLDPYGFTPDFCWDREPGPEPRELEAARVPRGLPVEIARYLEGALAYHRGDWDRACQSWSSLLELPAGQRQLRSTWAAYMLARAAADLRPDEAVARAGQVRELVARGFSDTLGLLADAAGLEARVALSQGDPLRAVHLYAQQAAAGVSSAYVSLRLTLPRLLECGPEALAADPLARRLVTAYLLAFHYGSRETGRVSAWLEACESVAAEPFDGADRLAWLAYHAGDFDAAERWLALAPADATIVLWLEAKLLLRRGDLDGARALLSQIAPRDQPDGDAYPMRQPLLDGYDLVPEHGEVGTSLAELALLRLVDGELVPALQGFLRAGAWIDAAYVAERLLTPEELRDLLSSGAIEARPPRSGAGSWAKEDPVAALRHLLARRLARAGRWSEAVEHYPSDLAQVAARYTELVEAARAPGRTAAERAPDLWQAALIRRELGPGLLATELGPDFFVYGGSFQGPALHRSRAEAEAGGQVVSDLERKRLARHVVEPDRRWHYVYGAADLAWEAASLMPDNEPGTALALCVAGSWLKARDPQAADRFYKALVRRCGRTELGLEAERLRWFPECSAEPEPL